MRHIFKCTLPFLAVLMIACDTNQQVSNGEERQTELVFAKGEKITNSNFVGTAWLQPLVAADSINQTAVGSVTFEPGARSNWHSHPSGQIILALEGEGYYQEKGSQKIILSKGDVKKCPANVPHWHGASAGSTFIQVAITGRERGETVWLEPVTDEEYSQGDQ